MMQTKMIEWLETNGLAQYMQESLLAFPIAEVIHVMALAIVVGTIFVVDLRLLNLGAKSYPLSALMRTLLPITLVAFAFAVGSGVAMFSSQPSVYLAVTVFWVKMGLLAFAGVNMAVFHLWTQRSLANWNEGDAIPAAARAAGLLSIVSWVAILVAGRFVGFLL